MRITAIDTAKVFVPWRESLAEAMVRWRQTNNQSTVEVEDAYIIMRMRTDEGLVGIGEGGRDVQAIHAQAEPLIGTNPLELDPWSLEPPFLHAVFDLLGKAHGVPVCRLLGGKHRDAIPVAYWSPHCGPEEAARFAEEGRERGFRVHKIKGRPEDAADMIRAMAAAAGPDYAIRVDPNETFRQPSVAARIDAAVADCNVECWEDPVPKAHLEWYELLRAKCRAPLCLHTSDPALMLDAIKRNAVDYFNISGPPATAYRAAALADAAGCPYWLQMEGHCLDIAAAFVCHLGAALPGLALPSDVLPFLRCGSIVANPPEVRDGLMRVPDGPGLGVELDEGAIRRYHVG